MNTSSDFYSMTLDIASGKFLHRPGHPPHRERWLDPAAPGLLGSKTAQPTRPGSPEACP